MPTFEDRLRQLENSNRKLQRDLDLVRRIGYVDASTDGTSGVYVPVSRTIFTSGGLTGGASLRNDVSLSINLGTGLTVDASSKLVVDDDLFYHGLQWDAVNGRVSVKPAIEGGIVVTSDGVFISASLAGTGLDWDNTAKNIKITATNGLAVSDNSIAVALSNGLEFSNSAVTIKKGQGLAFFADAPNNSRIGIGEGSGIQVNTDNVAVRAGAGLGFSGSDLVVGEGSGLVVNADTVAVRPGPGVQLLLNTQTNKDEVAVRAGDGLGFSSDDLVVNTGNGIKIDSDNVTVDAGAGLTFDGSKLIVAKGNGILVKGSVSPFVAPSVELGLPSTLSINSADAVTTNSHTHAITSSANVLTTDAILRSASGKLTLKNLDVSTVIQSLSEQQVVGINVTPDGSSALDVRAAVASDHTLRIKRISGQTGRLFRVENANTPAQELIVLDSVGNLQSGNPGFVSGLTGWRITPEGNAEFNNGTFRGELRASVFAIEEIHASPGTLIVSRSAGKLREDVTLVSTGVVSDLKTRKLNTADDFVGLRTTSINGTGTVLSVRSIRNLIAMEDPESGHAHQLFYTNEILQVKAFTGTGVHSIWMKVNNEVDNTTHYSYYVQIMDGSLPATFWAGTAVVAHGLPGKGAIKLSADGNYTPNLDVYTIGARPWLSDIFPHVRLGRLDGVGLPGIYDVEQYGLVLGTNLADANSPYMIASNLGMKLYSIDSEWNDGINPTARIESTGRARFGTDVDNTATTFLDINPATATATFKGEIQATTGVIGGFTIGATKLTAGATNETSVGISTGVDTSDVAFFAGHLTPTSAPFRVTEAGALFSSSGVIGGFAISATTLTAGLTNATSVGISTGDNTDGISFFAGHLTAGSAPFRVTRAGALISTSGVIGGFIIGESTLLAGSGNTRVGISTGATTSNVSFYAGSDTPTSADFYVRNDGFVKATLGSIGGFGISSSAINAGSIANATSTGIISSSVSGNTAFYAGSSSSPSSAPFRVTNTGILNATGAIISGAITAISGSFTGNITIDGGTLSTVKTGVTDKTYLNSDGFFIYSAGNTIGSINNSINWTAPVNNVEVRSAYISYQQNTVVTTTTGTMRLQAGTNANKPAVLTLNYSNDPDGTPAIESNTNFEINNISTNTGSSWPTILKLQGWRLGTEPFSKIEFWNSTSRSAEIRTTKATSGATPTIMKLLVSNGSGLIDALTIDTESGAGKITTGITNATTTTAATINATTRYRRSVVTTVGQTVTTTEHNGGIFVPVAAPYAIKPTTTNAWNNIILDPSKNINAPTNYLFNVSDGQSTNVTNAIAVLIYLSFTWDQNNAEQKAAVSFGDLATTLTYADTKIVGQIEALSGQKPMHGHFVVPLNQSQFKILVSERTGVPQTPVDLRLRATCRLIGYYI